MIEINNLSYFYDDNKENCEGIKNINLKVNEGEFVAIVGPSGSGKTTFLNVLANIFVPTKGSVKVDGQELKNCINDISVMFQHCTLLPWWNLEKNINFFISKSHRNISKTKIVELTDYVLKKIGLYEAKRKYPSQLSGGMQQRGALGRAFAMKSKVLLLDEPFGSLDINNRYQLQDLLATLVAQKQKTIIMVTHDINEAIYLADKICFFQSGKLIKDFKVPLERPRVREDIVHNPEYGEIKKELLELFLREG